MIPAPFRVLAFTAGHLLVALLVGVVAFGTDMDRLRSRSLASRAAGAVHDVLWFPHDTFMHAIPNRWLVTHPAVIPGAILGNSLLWGIALYLVWRLSRRP